MDDQPSLRKVETVRLCFPRTVNDLILFVFREFRQVVDELHLVFALGHAERELEFEVGEQSVPEVVSFHEDKVGDRLVSHHVEFKFECQSLQVEELRRELVLDSARIHRDTAFSFLFSGVIIGLLLVFLADTHQDSA